MCCNDRSPPREEAPMERNLGSDVHARSCTLAVLSQAGKRLRHLVVETNGQALIEAIRTIPGRKHLCLE